MNGSPYNLRWAAPSLKIADSHGGSWSPSNTWFLGPTWVHNPNSISIDVLPTENMPPHFSDHVYYGQMTWWIRIPLGMEVCIGTGNTVLDREGPTSPGKGAQQPPTFRPTALARFPTGPHFTHNPFCRLAVHGGQLLWQSYWNCHPSSLLLFYSTLSKNSSTLASRLNNLFTKLLLINSSNIYYLRAFFATFCQLTAKQCA